ncbi:MAG TPA: hypothetical protein VNF04_07160 [Stellaceae bacterium]|nr:hypothetical protein [Stellaceae bacterium]
MNEAGGGEEQNGEPDQRGDVERKGIRWDQSFRVGSARLLLSQGSDDTCYPLLRKPVE